MSAASAVRLVAGREVRERGRSKVFWVGTSVVLAGAVHTLKQRGSPTLVLEVEGAGADWYAGLPTAAVEHVAAGRVRVTVCDADPQVVLDRARAAGQVRRFALEEPSLSELFLQAVGP